MKEIALCCPTHKKVKRSINLSDRKSANWAAQWVVLKDTEAQAMGRHQADTAARMLVLTVRLRGACTGDWTVGAQALSNSLVAQWEPALGRMPTVTQLVLPVGSKAQLVILWPCQAYAQSAILFFMVNSSMWFLVKWPVVGSVFFCDFSGLFTKICELQWW